MIGLAILFVLGFALADELRRRRGNRAAPLIPRTPEDAAFVAEAQSEFLRGHGVSGAGPL
jgi:hypothetical protein